MILAQRETRTIHFATDDAKTNSNLVYSYALLGQMPNITINSFTTVKSDPTYGTCGVLTIAANATQSSYGDVMIIYAYDTITGVSSATRLPLTFSIQQNPTVV